MTSVLVAYASRRGATREIAEVIADKLREYDLAVDCLPVSEAADLSTRDAIVLGSAVYAHQWRHDGLSFLHRHARTLAKVPFWVFSSGPVGAPGAALDPAWLEPPRVLDAARRLGARGHVVFGGRLPRRPVGPIERALVATTPPHFRDRRDWAAIRTWAAKIGNELQAADRLQQAQLPATTEGVPAAVRRVS